MYADTNTLTQCSLSVLVDISCAEEGWRQCRVKIPATNAKKCCKFIAIQLLFSSSCFVLRSGLRLFLYQFSNSLIYERSAYEAK
ncbi:Tax1-binding protein [Dirofilaria immitis]